MSTTRKAVTALISLSIVSLILAACSSTPSNKQKASSVVSGAIQPIIIAQQAQRWALPWYIATQKGWWADAGLKPTFSTFEEGSAEVAAGESGSWDVGGAGDMPSLTGSAGYGLINIAIADREEKILTIMAANPTLAKQYLANPKLLIGKTIPVTFDSTGQWIAEECMSKKFHLSPSQYTFLNLTPPEINSAMDSGKYTVSEVWSPNTYILKQKLGAVEICNGGQLHIPVTSNIFATPKYASSHPQQVAEFLAVTERAISWEHNHMNQAATMLNSFLTSVGVVIPQKDDLTELQLRPDYILDQQINRFNGGTNSVFTHWTQLVTSFMQSIGAQVPSNLSSVISEKYLLMVKNNKQLDKFANDR